MFSKRWRFRHVGVVCLLGCVVAPLPVLAQDGGPAVSQEDSAASDMAPVPQRARGGPQARPYQPLLDDVRPSSFQEITPGQTSKAELSEQLGEPKTRRMDGDVSTFTYEVGPLSNVEILCSGDKVSSIRIHLPDSEPLDQVEIELGLTDFSPVAVSDSKGKVLGLAYPERGVILAGRERDAEYRITEIVLEPIVSEMFVLRAAGDASGKFEQQLADLDYALKVYPGDERAHWQRAKTLLLLQRPNDALEAGERAIQLDADEFAYQLVVAEALAATGKTDMAKQRIEQILAQEHLPPDVSARAHARLGDLLYGNPEHDYREAMKQHQLAIQLATPLASDGRDAQRHEARRLLIEAFMGVAGDIAASNWEGRVEAFPKWLDGGKKLADAVVKDGGDEALQFLVLRKSVAAYGEAPKELSRDAPVEEAIETGKRLVETADPSRKQALETDLAMLYVDAARVVIARGDHAKTREFAQQAIALCERLAGEDQASGKYHAWIGRLYFYMGSTFAIQEENHSEAVRWYERALPHLERAVVRESGPARGHLGEQFVSMGISYWETGVRDEAVTLTRKGLEMMRHAARVGDLSQRALAVPYGNLASMYKSLGKHDEARKMAVVAAKLERESEGDISP